MDIKENRLVFRKAVYTFLGLAAIVFLGAVIYSLATSHATAAILLGVAALLIAGLATWMVRTEA